MNQTEIIQTTPADLETVLWLFARAMELQGKNGYKVWQTIDNNTLRKDIADGLQYKLIEGNDLLGVFSVQLNDPFIWRDRDRNDAVYLHRIVVNPRFKGQKQFQKIVDWATAFARKKGLSYVRMDTWADNQPLISYYRTFGFRLIEYYTTPNAVELPVQNRNLHIALLEMELSK
jgi:ribosomal protein S18 acetylase RimI-like enzyme